MPKKKGRRGFVCQRRRKGGMDVSVFTMNSSKRVSIRGPQSRFGVHSFGGGGGEEQEKKEGGEKYEKKEGGEKYEKKEGGEKYEKKEGG